MIGFLEGFLALVIGKKQSKENCSQSLLNTDIANFWREVWKPYPTHYTDFLDRYLRLYGIFDLLIICAGT